MQHAELFQEHGHCYMQEDGGFSRGYHISKDVPSCRGRELDKHFSSWRWSYTNTPILTPTDLVH